MNFWLFCLVGRILAGEPYERSTKADLRLWGSVFAFIPLFVTISTLVLGTFHNAPAWGIGLAVTALTFGYFFLWQGVLRRFPIGVLVLCAAISWPLFAVMVWTR